MSIKEIDNMDRYQNKELKEEDSFNKEFIFDKKKNIKINEKAQETSIMSINKLAQGIANMNKKKIMYFSAIIIEKPIDIMHSRGNTNIPMLLKSDIKDKINRIMSSNRSKIGYIYIEGIQIMIKIHFRDGIDSPLNIIVLDNNIKNRKCLLLGIIQEYISCKKLIFKTYPKYFISLRNRNINKTLTLSNDFKYFDILYDGSYPYSIAYAIEYALINLTNSKMFANRKFIETDKLFIKVGKI